MSSGTYEVWIETLRNLSDDDATSLDDLPHLSNDSFSPSTFQRLTKHLNAAFENMQNDWSSQFRKRMERVGNDTDLTDALLQSRRDLAKQVELAHCVALPPVLREAFTKQIGEYIFSLQEQLEKNGVNEHLSKLDLRGRDHWLRIVRRSPLTAVLRHT
ncbi:hypothetical protein [Corynebacterium resistens]|uniref:hypothetical protein n=1 Tax=Corynebacterium resistens TaxID=258224 RepID=UPI0023523752|nr:hypothetical protein [Corynebacterium resistens]